MSSFNPFSAYGIHVHRSSVWFVESTRRDRRTALLSAVIVAMPSDSFLNDFSLGGELTASETGFRFARRMECVKSKSMRCADIKVKFS